MPPPFKLALALTLLVARVAPAFAAWPNQSAVNLPVCTAANPQYLPQIVSDGAGGAIVTWYDLRSGTNNDIYAQHVLASGTVDPAWPANGRAVCTATGDQNLPQLVADGGAPAAGGSGAIITWFDLRSGISWDIYAQHVLASGATDPAWPVNGRALCTTPEDQISPTIVSDGVGGAIVAWQDYRGGASRDIYAQHVLASGAVDPAWPADGRAVCAAANNQQAQVIVTDGGSGAIIAWSDRRNGSNYDIYAQHVLASGAVDPAWPADGKPLCTAAYDQGSPAITSDGSGGAIVTWYDIRSGTNNDIYAQHVLASGSTDPSWPTDGMAVCAAGGYQYSPTIVSDGAGGAFVAWQDLRSGAGSDLYAQHLLASGIADPSWPADGRALCTAAGDQSSPVIATDGSGGAIVTWLDQRNGSYYDIYAQHLLASGGSDYAWPTDGRAVSTATVDQDVPAAVSDGTGGVIVTWQDDRTGFGHFDIYAQRVAKGGYLGTPEGEMAGVRDVPLDNGGRVRVSWTASYLEFDASPTYVSYYLFRSVPLHAAAQTLARDTRLRPAGAAALQPGDLISTSAGSTTLFWEMVTSVSGMGVPGYSFVTATTSDSAGAGNPKTLFMVQTRTGNAYWNSPPDSGYSVDNLPPGTPAAFAGAWSGGATALHWNPGVDADLAGYRVYRGGTPDFAPGSGNLVASTTATSVSDPASRPYDYKLTAVDIHGNESAPAALVPTGTTAVGNAPAVRELSLSPASPNPAARGTTLRFALPSAANVSLGVYDPAGRLVRVLADGAMTAGEHAAAWDLRDDAGRVAGAGLYFARLEVAGETRVRRIAVTP